MALESFKPQNSESSSFRASSALSAEVNEVWGRNISADCTEQKRPPLGEEDRQGRNGELERSLQVQLNMGLESTGSLYGQINSSTSTRPDAAPLTDEQRQAEFAAWERSQLAGSNVDGVLRPMGPMGQEDASAQGEQPKERVESNFTPLTDEQRQAEFAAWERSQLAGSDVDGVLRPMGPMGQEDASAQGEQPKERVESNPTPLTDEQRQAEFAAWEKKQIQNGGTNDEVLARTNDTPVGSTNSPESDLGFGGGEKTGAGVPEGGAGLQGSPDARLSQAQPQEYVGPESYRAQRAGDIYNGTPETTTTTDILNGQPETDRVEQNIQESRIRVGDEQLRFPSREDFKSMPIEELAGVVEQNQGALQQFYSQHENDIPLIGFHGATEPNLSAFVQRGESFPGRNGTYFAAVSELDKNPAVAISDLEHSAQFVLPYMGRFKENTTPGGIAVFDLSQYADGTGRSFDQNRNLDLDPKNKDYGTALGTVLPRNFAELAVTMQAADFQSSFQGVIPYSAFSQFDNLYDDPIESPDSFHRQLLAETLQLQMITGMALEMTVGSDDEVA